MIKSPDFKREFRISLTKYKIPWLFLTRGNPKQANKSENQITNLPLLLDLELAVRVPLSSKTKQNNTTLVTNRSKRSAKARRFSSDGNK